MTLCMAARYKGGVVVASDGALTMDEQRIQSTKIKGGQWGSLFVLYAGDLCNVDKVLDAKPTQEDWKLHARELQHRLWEAKFPPEEGIEFLLVDWCLNISLLSSEGDHVGGYPYACIGTPSGWVGLDLEYPPIRNKSLYNVKSAMGRVFRAVERRENGVYKPYYYEALVPGWNIR